MLRQLQPVTFTLPLPLPLPALLPLPGLLLLTTILLPPPQPATARCKWYIAACPTSASKFPSQYFFDFPKSLDSHPPKTAISSRIWSHGGLHCSGLEGSFWTAKNLEEKNNFEKRGGISHPSRGKKNKLQVTNPIKSDQTSHPKSHISIYFWTEKSLSFKQIIYKSRPRKSWSTPNFKGHFVSKLVSEIRLKNRSKTRPISFPTLQFPVHTSDPPTMSMAFIVSRSMLCFEERYATGDPQEKRNACHPAKDTKTSFVVFKT